MDGESEGQQAFLARMRASQSARKQNADYAVVNPQQEKTLLIREVDQMTEDEILALFHPTFKDDIESIRLFPPIPGTRGFAFVEFKDAMAAIRAFTSKHRSMFTYRGVQKKLNLSRPTKGKPDDDQSKWARYEERLKQNHGRAGADSTPRRMAFSKGVAVAPTPPGAVHTVPFTEVFRALVGTTTPATAPRAPAPENSSAPVETGQGPSATSSQSNNPQPPQTPPPAMESRGEGGIPVFEAQEPVGHAVIRRGQQAGIAERKPASRLTSAMSVETPEHPASPLRLPSPPRQPHNDPFADPPVDRAEALPPTKKRSIEPLDSNPFRPTERARHSPPREAPKPRARSQRPPELSTADDPFRLRSLVRQPPPSDSTPFEALVSNPEHDPFEDRRRRESASRGDPFEDRRGAFLRAASDERQPASLSFHSALR
eukprot:GGOE01049464.1.p1 GENE.GGOE01049464.1~~GGOE01049464.1.p1  ORF type:complete len:429 (+),score=56.30 GGOE01049464.1:39-1325(+)